MYRSVFVSLVCFAGLSELNQAMNLNELEPEETLFAQIESDSYSLAHVGSQTQPPKWGKPDEDGGAAKSLFKKKESEEGESKPEPEDGKATRTTGPSRARRGRGQE